MCAHNCTACSFIKPGNSLNINSTTKWKINQNVNCETSNCIYILECEKCKKFYIGETGRMLKARLSDHRGYINQQVFSVTTGDHINIPGHSLANLKVSILEAVKKNYYLYRKERETYFNNKFNTYYHGLNREM